MKSQKKNAQGLYLQKSNNRWKWMAGAAAAGVTASQASAITINLVGNFISSTEGNHLNADLTGDGNADLAITNPYVFSRKYSHGSPSSFFYRRSAAVHLNGVSAFAFVYGDARGTGVRLGSQYKTLYGIGSSLMGSIPITFKDLHINGGAPTKGSLDVTVSDFGLNGSPSVQLDSFTYSTPDQGSSLALLAIGAGGILALRRWRAAQGRS